MDSLENPNFEKYKKAKEEIFSDKNEEDYSEETNAFLEKGAEDTARKKEADENKRKSIHTPAIEQGAKRNEKRQRGILGSDYE